jgi:methionyl-tRNA formyltransferase
MSADRKRIIYFGTPRFAATVLEMILESGAHVVAVVTKPDKPLGRSSELKPPPVKVVAEKHQIPVLQPRKASTPEFAEILKEFRPDLFLVVAYAEIFKEILLELPPLGCVNVHASLLPKYRGAAPIHRSVMAGDKETGVTIMSMEKELDAGEILSVAKTAIGPDMTTGELFEVLAHLGGQELVKVLPEIENRTIKRVKQDPALVTHAPKVTPETGEVDWSKPAQVLHDHIRGQTPKPGAWCWAIVKGAKKRFHIKKTKVEPFQGSPGEILSQKGFIVACGEGALNLLEVQLEGKKAMPADQFLRGIAKNEIQFQLK